jgi:uncharacterized protein YdaT
MSAESDEKVKRQLWQEIKELAIENLHIWNRLSPIKRRKALEWYRQQIAEEYPTV